MCPIRVKCLGGFKQAGFFSKFLRIARFAKFFEISISHFNIKITENNKVLNTTINRDQYLCDSQWHWSEDLL